MREDLLAAWGDFDQSVRNDPYPLYAEVRNDAPVCRVRLADGHSAWLISRYDDARPALSDSRMSKDMLRAMEIDASVVSPGLPGPRFARHMLSVDPPDHTRLRGLVSKAFTTRRLETLRPRVQEITEALLDDMAGGQDVVDLVAAFAFPLPMRVICELLGVPLEDRDPLRARFTAMLASSAVPENDPLARHAAEAIVTYFTELVASRRAHPADDLLTGLIEARDGGQRLTEQELLSTVFQLIVAGHDTTANLISNGVVALLTHPDQMAALRQDASLIPAAVEELLRFDAPVQHATFRYTTEPVTIGGITIPANEQVMVVLAAANRDPERFSVPDDLDIHRRENHRHLAFGHGVHFCLGAPLARMEGQIAFASLLRRLPRLRLAVPVEELRWKHGLVLRGLSELPIRLAPETVGH
jgi:cytochrome P450